MSTTGIIGKINALLAQNQHRDESYLVCCTLLSRMQPSIVAQFLNQHVELCNHLISLIRLEDKGDAKELKRLGIRLLSLYMTESGNFPAALQPKDWERLIDLLSKRCKDMAILEFLDIELLQLITMGLEMNILATDNETNKDSNISFCPSFLKKLPPLLLQRCCNSSVLSEKSKDQSLEVDNGISYILKTLLDEQYSDNKDQIAAESFRESAVHFFVTHSTFIQSNQKFKVPVDECFISNTARILFEDVWNSNVPKMSSQTHTLLHYSLLTYVLMDITIDGLDADSSDFCIISEMKAGNNKVVKPILKMIFSGITSSNSTELNVKEMTGENMVRTLTIKMLANLIDNAGIGWTKVDHDKSQFGECATLCSLVRLVAGELRISLGRLVDLSLAMKDPDRDLVSIPQEEGDWILRSEQCLEVALHALRIMLDMASDYSDQSNSGLAFNPDAILHMRHSLEDFLDSCVQFLLEDLSDKSFAHWRSSVYSCCRFFGAYLSQVDIFAYDSPDNDEEEENTEEGKKTTTSTNLLRALRNGLIMLGISEERDDSVLKVTTLFPCLVATLTCCENQRQNDIVERYLLTDATVWRIVEKALMVSTEGFMRYSHSSLDNLSWCCLCVDSILGVSRRSHGAKPVAEALRTTAMYLMKMVMNGDVPAILLEEDISSVLKQVMMSLIEVVKANEDDGRDHESIATIEEIRSFLSHTVD